MIKSKILILFLLISQAVWAQEDNGYKPRIGGTLRGKYEYQTAERENRFQVRTARVNVQGKVAPIVEYKAEIDLCDEGAMKMLDVYTRLTPWKTFTFTIGQMRAPFTIDAHRSPHLQYFANRSFIAKQVGNVRDVGAMVGYEFRPGFPIRLQAGLYNGSGVSGQKDFWTKGINFSAKAQFCFPFNLDLETSVQKIRPDEHTVMMYDVGLTFHRRCFLAEVEYLYKTYAHGIYQNVHALDAFVNYDFPMRSSHCLLRKISPQVRYDFMTDHSDGKHISKQTPNDPALLTTTDYRRHRVTGGLTLSLATPFVSDIRINFEKYFYRDKSLAKTSERDKIVVEFMTHF